MSDNPPNVGGNGAAGDIIYGSTRESTLNEVPMCSTTSDSPVPSHHSANPMAAFIRYSKTTLVMEERKREVFGGVPQFRFYHEMRPSRARAYRSLSIFMEGVKLGLPGHNVVFLFKSSLYNLLMCRACIERRTHAKA